MKWKLRYFSLALALGGMFSMSIANAAESQPYKGKTLTVLINYATGGPTDIEGRLVAKTFKSFKA